MDSKIVRVSTQLSGQGVPTKRVTVPTKMLIGKIAKAEKVVVLQLEDALLVVSTDDKVAKNRQYWDTAERMLNNTLRFVRNLEDCQEVVERNMSEMSDADLKSLGPAFGIQLKKQ